MLTCLLFIISWLADTYCTPNSVFPTSDPCQSLYHLLFSVFTQIVGGLAPSSSALQSEGARASVEEYRAQNKEFFDSFTASLIHTQHGIDVTKACTVSSTLVGCSVLAKPLLLVVMRMFYAQRWPPSNGYLPRQICRVATVLKMITRVLSSAHVMGFWLSPRA